MLTAAGELPGARREMLACCFLTEHLCADTLTLNFQPQEHRTICLHLSHWVCGTSLRQPPWPDTTALLHEEGAVSPLCSSLSPSSFLDLAPDSLRFLGGQTIPLTHPEPENQAVLHISTTSDSPLLEVSKPGNTGAPHFLVFFFENLLFDWRKIP